jgi:hypothetical protein
MFVGRNDARVNPASPTAHFLYLPARLLLSGRPARPPVHACLWAVCKACTVRVVLPSASRAPHNFFYYCTVVSVCSACVCLSRQQPAPAKSAAAAALLVVLPARPSYAVGRNGGCRREQIACPSVSESVVLCSARLVELEGEEARERAALRSDECSVSSTPRRAVKGGQ